MLWTHYFDAEAMRDRPDALARFVGTERATSEGFAHTLHRQRYRYGTGFCGGSRPESCWIERDELVAALRHVGYARVEVLDDDRGHPGGPAVLVVATGAGVTPGPGRT